MNTNSLTSPAIPKLYEDQHILIVDKPSGILVHRTKEAPDKITLIQLIEHQYGQRAFPAHRLDRQTSGVLIFAKDSQTASSLGQQLMDHQVKKEYLALVRNKFPEQDIQCDRPLTSDRGESQPASTVFRLLRNFERVALITAFPTTGRRHQIRRHLNHLGHHIIGDTKYGKGGINREFRSQYGLNRMFLHATTVSFYHPKTNIHLNIKSPLPDNLTKVLHPLL